MKAYKPSLFLALLTLLVTSLANAGTLIPPQLDGGGNTAGGPNGEVRANQIARETMTAILNFHRGNADLPPVTVEEVFATEVIVNDQVQVVYRDFKTLGELGAFLWTAPQVEEANIAFNQTSPPFSNMASWAMGWTIDRMGDPSKTLEEAFPPPASI